MTVSHRITPDTLWVWARRLALALALGLLLLIVTAAPAWASIHTYHEQPGQTTFRSRQSLRDQRDMAWQATVFKRYRGSEIQGIYLRLVGFPGQVTVDRQGDLTIDTGTTAHWIAPYALDPQTPASVLPDNVSQYDLAAVLTVMPRPIPLTLSVPLVGQAPAQLVVAPYVVKEWLTIAQTLPDP
ncbi:DUF3122 domain-containing protein [Phormidium sp. FACHB-1136]|uniref:DUF3122 domain-containing protein n=1 Tax=Phormidium sp. FACHB-1136 TaxID=2692848 RepID=UPI001689F0F0|nr:DUF3122 domain-containing protein [Phormidium sp. FACHB-1136]MBD2425663.1 DUF3122 domain-containing protein [Phormidium sp. FACHB-1136]